MAIFVSAPAVPNSPPTKKITRDISYGLQILFFIGDLMFTIFGAVDKSWSMFIGNGVSTFFCVIQIAQKIYYDQIL